MKRVIQILLLILIIILSYMCIVSIRNGMQEENPDKTPAIESLEK
jgi:uncharacterized membrane protein